MVAFPPTSLKGNSGVFFYHALISVFSDGTDDSPVTARVVQFFQKHTNNFKWAIESRLQTEMGKCFMQHVR